MSRTKIQHRNLPSMTKREFAADADINNLVAKFSVKHKVPLNLVPEYMQNYLPPDEAAKYPQEFVTSLDYLDAVQLRFQADEAFMALPARLGS